MPYLRTPSGKYIEVPEGLSDEQAVKLARRQFPALYGIETNMGGQLREFVRGVPAGVVGSFGQAARGIGALLPDEYEKPFAAGVDKAVSALTPEAAEGYDDSVGRKLGQAMGSVLSFLGPAGAAGVGARALGAGKLATKAAQLGTAGAMGSAAGAGEARTRAEEAEATDAQRRTVTQGGALIGLSEIAPVQRFLGSIGDVALTGIVSRIKRMLVSGGVEAAQEMAANAAQNLLAREVYKPDQEIVEGVGEGGAYGFGAGALTQALLDLALGKKARPPAPAAPAQDADRQKAEQEAVAAQQERQAQVEAGFAPEGQGRLFGGDASPLPISNNAQQIYRALQEAEQKGDTQTASQLRNDLNRLQSELSDPEALAQRRQELQEARDNVTEQIQAVAGKDPAAIKELRQKGAAITQELKRLDGLLAQMPVTPSREQAEKKLRALNKQLEKAKTEGDEAAMDALTDKIVALRPLTAQTGDLLAGVPDLDMLTATDRTNIDFDERNPQGQVQQQPQQDDMFADQFMGQLDATQQARIQQARAVAEAQRKQRQMDAGIEEASARAEAMAREAPLESILVGKGVKLRETEARRRHLAKLQNDIDSGNVTTQVASMLGLPDIGVNLQEATPQQIEETLRVIDNRLKELIDDRNNVFPSKELVKDGELTRDGRVLVGTEAAIGELQKLQSVAQQYQQQKGLTPAEAGLLGTVDATLGERDTTTPEQRKAAAEKRAADINKFAEQRKTQMFNWGNEIDSLRKGDDAGDVSRRAAELRAEQIALLAKMEAAKRAEQAGAQMPVEAQEQLERDVHDWLGRITKNAKPGESEGALQKALREKGVARQGPIERGMTITDTREGELARLQQGVDRLIAKAVEPFKRQKPKKQKGPFGLVQQSAAVLSRQYDERQAQATPETKEGPDLSGRQREMFPGSVTETTKKKQAAEKRAATIQAKKQTQLEETKALMQKAAAEKAEKERKLARRKRVSDFWKSLRKQKKDTQTRNARERLKSLDVLQGKLEKEIVATKAELETERLANVKLQGLANLGKLTNVKFSGETKQHLRGLEAQLDAVKAAIAKTQAEVAALDKRDAAEAARKAKAKVRLPEGQVVKEEERKPTPPRKPLTPEEKADRDAADTMRERVETQEQFVEEAESAIDTELMRLERMLADDFSGSLAERNRLEAAIENYVDAMYGFSESRIRETTDKVEAERARLREYARTAGRAEFRNRLLKENAALQQAKKDLVPFKAQLRALQKQEASLAREQRVKQLRQRVLESVDKVAASMKRTDQNENARSRRVDDVLADIAQGRIKGQRGVRVEQVATTLPPAIEGRIKNLEDKMDALGEGVKDRRARAELQEQIDQLRERGYGLISRRFDQKTDAPIDADLSEIETAQIKQSRALNIPERKEQPVGRVAPAREINRVKERYLALQKQGKDKQAKALREKHMDLFLGPLEGLVRGIENNEGRRTPKPLKTGLAEYTAESGSSAGALDTEGLGLQRRAVEPDFRDAADTDTGIAPEAAKEVADRVKAALPEGVNFVYAPTLADAPAAFKEALARTGRKAAKGAVMPDGTVVVVGEAHSSTADLEATIAHELIGHYGADMVLGPDGVNAMVERLTSKGMDHMAEVATGLGLFPDVASARLAMPDNASAQVKTVLVREMIAQAAEGRRVAPKFVEKVKEFVRDMISKVRGFFRSAGLSHLARQDTKAIQKVISDASKALAAGRLGVYRTPDGQVVFRGGEATQPADMPKEVWDLHRKLVGSDKQPLVAKLKANLWGLGGMTQFVDRFTPVKWAADIGVKLGKITDLEALQNNYYLSSFGKRLNHVRDTIENGPRVLVEKTEDGETFRMIEAARGDAPSLTKMFRALEKSGLTAAQNEEMFTVYMAAQRIKNKGVGLNKLNRSEEVTPEAVKKYEDYIKSKPEVVAAFDQARKIYNEFNKGLVQFAVDAGALSKEQFKLLTDKKDYIPFYRERNGNYELVLDDSSAPIIIGNLKDQPYMQELIGGDKRILPIFESALQNVNLLTDMALRNLATKDTAMLVSKLGMTKNYKKKDTGAEQSIIPGLGGAGADVLRFKLDGKDVHIRVQTEGTAFENIPAELLVKGMEGVKTTFPATLQLLGLPAKLLRRFIVLSPLYPIRQIVRESLSALGTSGANFVPVYGPLKNIASALRGTNETAKILQSQGFGGGQLMVGASNTEQMAILMRAAASGKTTAGTILAKMESMSMMTDVGLRSAAYDSFQKQGLNSLRRWIATNELIDFNRQGLEPSVYLANTMIPFFNTQIQGLSVLARAATGNMPMNDRLKIRDKFLQRAMMMAGVTMAYAAMMQDDEAYKNASPETRLSNWFIRVPGLAEPLKVPIPFEFGLLFKSIPEAIYNTAFQQEEFEPIAKALAGQALNSIPGMSGYMLPQAFKPVVEQATGTDFFTGRKIETPGMEMLDPGERYGDTTTELSKLLGRTAGVSPARLDHFIKSVGSQTLLALVSMTNDLISVDNPPSATAKTSKTPLLGGAFQPTDAGGIINRVYEKLEEATQAKNTYDKLMGEGRDARAEAYLNKNMNRIMMAGSAPAFRNEMRQLTEYERAVKADRDMSPAEKRELLDEIRKMKIETATTYRDVLREAA